MHIFRKNNWCVGGTYIKKKGRIELDGHNASRFITTTKKQAIFTYLRIHGGRGYRGELSENELHKLKKQISARKGKRKFCYV